MQSHVNLKIKLFGKEYFEYSVLRDLKNQLFEKKWEQLKRVINKMNVH